MDFHNVSSGRSELMGGILFNTISSPVVAEYVKFKLAITLITIPPALRYLERLWGSIETLKFIVATVGVSNIIAFGFNWIEFVGTSNADMFLCVVTVIS